MPYVIKNIVSGKFIYFKLRLKNLPNKYFNFGQLLLSFVVNIGESFY